LLPKSFCLRRRLEPVDQAFEGFGAVGSSIQATLVWSENTKLRRPANRASASENPLDAIACIIFKNSTNRRIALGAAFAGVSFEVLALVLLCSLMPRHSNQDLEFAQFG
jgi:hypothetical protein